MEVQAGCPIVTTDQGTLSSHRPAIIFSTTLSASLGQLVIDWFNFDLQEREYFSCMSI